MLFKCKYNDCGWCYAPPETATNEQSGQCLQPKECPERQREAQELSKIAKVIIMNESASKKRAKNES